MIDQQIINLEIIWKSKTLKGNAFFKDGCWQESLVCYKEALGFAEQINTFFETSLASDVPVLQIYIISCNNISHVYLETNEIERAGKLLERVVFYLLHHAENKQLDFQMIQREIKRATVTLLNFLRDHNLLEQQEVFLAEIKEQLILNQLITAL